ncbi:helix-turn-helix domain-containing protein [Streptomyces sp. NPDC006527]|jgi:transcriptional regulator with XRE-family HTH domain|uniref:helix-turn-helix domain-containing protein n=1 Tax=Streptomyces sp. NPDC006527 TaxID=3364749 RepID=UPI0036971472
MPRWKDLPDELDPQVGEFVGRLRRIVERGGLTVPQLADRTHYGRASWERYLNGRLLAPKGAVVALAEVTGTDPAPLVTLWELAERAWSRAELRQDRASEALRLSRAGTVTAPKPGIAGPAGVSPTLPPRGPDEAAPEDAAPPVSRHAQRPALFLAGVVGVVIAVVGAFFVTDGGEPKRGTVAAASPSPSASPSPPLPPGVLCSGAGCTGKDAEEMGCSGNLVTTATSVTVGTTLVEVRYSRTCGAAWGRITRAGLGDLVRVTVGPVRQTGDITTAGDTIAYTPMVAVEEPGEARACAVLASGRQGCTG